MRILIILLIFSLIIISACTQIDPQELAQNHLAQSEDFQAYYGENIELINKTVLDCNNCYEFKFEYEQDSQTVPGATDNLLATITIKNNKVVDEKYVFLGQGIDTFEECVEAGYPVIETYPEQCSNGKNTFTRELTEEEKRTKEEKSNLGNNTQLANPASVNCKNIGGKLEIRNSELGQYGICIKNGSECEEWALFRGECSFEESRSYCTQAQKESKFCTMEFMPVCGFKEVECIKAPCPPVKNTYSNKCVACSNKVDYWIEGDCKSTKTI